MKLYRKPAENWLIKEVIEKLPAGKKNAEIYRETFANMSDDDMVRLLERYRKGEFYFPLFIYTMDTPDWDLDKVMEVGEAIGVEFFQRLILTDPISKRKYKTDVKYLIVDTDMRRQIQHLIKKQSTAKSTRVVDHLAGQATGESKAASMSIPESAALDGKGLQASLIEKLKVKGGDDVAFQMMLDSIEQRGGFSLQPILEVDSKPKAVETLDAFFKGMGFMSTLSQN